MVSKFQLSIAIIISVLAGIFLAHLLAFYQAPSVISSFANSPDNHEIERKLELAEREIASLKFQLENYKNTVPQSVPVHHQGQANVASASVNQTATTSEALYDAETKLALLRSEKYSRWLTDSIKKSPQFELGAEMQKYFESEPVNPEWAVNQERKISNLFIEKTELSGVALKEAKCRATQCQISMGIANIEQANLIAEKFSKLAAENKFTSLVAVPDQNNGITTLYITNNESGFELN